MSLTPPSRTLQTPSKRANSRQTKSDPPYREPVQYDARSYSVGCHYGSSVATERVPSEIMPWQQPNQDEHYAKTSFDPDSYWTSCVVPVDRRRPAHFAPPLPRSSRLGQMGCLGRVSLERRLQGAGDRVRGRRRPSSTGLMLETPPGRQERSAGLPPPDWSSCAALCADYTLPHGRDLVSPLRARLRNAAVMLGAYPPSYARWAWWRGDSQRTSARTGCCDRGRLWTTRMGPGCVQDSQEELLPSTEDSKVGRRRHRYEYRYSVLVLDSLAPNLAQTQQTLSCRSPPRLWITAAPPLPLRSAPRGAVEWEYRYLQEEPERYPYPAMRRVLLPDADAQPRLVKSTRPIHSRFHRPRRRQRESYADLSP